MSQSGSGGSGEGRPGEQPLPETIDQYTVTRRIGRGGQGEVLLGHDPNLDIDVAIKILHADYRTEEFLDRFKVEARTSVRLTAPNIVRVYAFNPAYPYLVMEYCADGDLTRTIKSRRPLPLRRSLGIVRQIAQALIAAHEHDPPILHRDLKPGNVLFQKDTPKVADFGLAKMLGATTGLTTTRGMMGTVGYASPEQLKDASKVDHRTDLWSVGVILYELLTFRRPFQKPGDDYVNVAIKVRMEPPAPPPFELPGPVWELITRGLQKDPEDRFDSASEIVQAIDGVLSSLGDAADMELPPPDSITEVDRMAAQAAELIEEGSTQNAAKHRLEYEEGRARGQLARVLVQAAPGGPGTGGRLRFRKQRRLQRGQGGQLAGAPAACDQGSARETGVQGGAPASRRAVDAGSRQHGRSEVHPADQRRGSRAQPDAERGARDGGAGPRRAGLSEGPRDVAEGREPVPGHCRRPGPARSSRDANCTCSS